MLDSGSAAVTRALEIVRQADLDPNDPAGVAIVSALLPHLLGELPDAGSSEEPGSGSRESAPKREDSPTAKTAAWARIDTTRVADIVEFSEDGARPIVVPNRLPASKAQQQRVLGILKLALDRVAYGREEVETKRIYQLCEAYGIADQNIHSNLISRGNFVNRRGPRGSQTYRLTVPGLEAARTLFVELADSDARLAL
jgi:hypothetical protein